MDFDNPKVYGDTSITDGLIVVVFDVVHPAMLCALRAVLEACELLRLI